nr:hypothetical protein [Lachnospiraceae bacterium]
MGLLSKIKEKISKKEERTYMDDYREGKITWDEAILHASSDVAFTMLCRIKSQQTYKWDLYQHNAVEKNKKIQHVKDYIQAKKDGYMYNPNSGENMTGAILESNLNCIKNLVDMYNNRFDIS